MTAIKFRWSGLLRGEFASLRSRLPSSWRTSYFVAPGVGARLSVIECAERIGAGAGRCGTPVCHWHAGRDALRTMAG
ncbi:MAG: hypothetical protein PHQ28_07285 [Mycobacterium sp.]|nr:hypothetical protein [Mycobacterium sp.]